MKKIAKSLTDLIGNTPLLELSNYNKKHELNGILVAKLEYFNPAGSVKDRIALSMIEDAEQKGLLKSPCHNYRTHKRKYRCRSRIRFGSKRLSAHTDHARYDEHGKAQSAQSIGSTVNPYSR